MTLNLTLPLASYLGLAHDPGQLDGYGPVAAGLARQIIADTERRHGGDGLAGMTWRCVVVDDVHGKVLGVGAPIRVPKHDPPPRLADLVRTSEPTCCFPGCRVQARDCDLDHRIPYDPGDPTGHRGGGATCACNLQPLCRKHHRLKTAGLIGVRALTNDDAEPGGAGVVPGTLEFTTATGLRYLRAPTRATPEPPDLDDPLIATAVAHADLRAAQRAVDQARMDAQIAADQQRLDAADRAARTAAGRPPAADFDGQDRAWRRSLHEHTRRRLRDAATRATRQQTAHLDPPF